MRAKPRWREVSWQASLRFWITVLLCSCSFIKEVYWCWVHWAEGKSYEVKPCDKYIFRWKHLMWIPFFNMDNIKPQTIKLLNTFTWLERWCTKILVSSIKVCGRCRLWVVCVALNGEQLLWCPESQPWAKYTRPVKNSLLSYLKSFFRFDNSFHFL